MPPRNTAGRAELSPWEQAEYFETGHLQKDLKSRVVRGGAKTSVAQVAKFALGFLSTVILARILSPTDYGLVAMVTVVTGFLSIFSQLGLSTATIQRAQINHGQVSTLFWINVLAGTVTCLITMAAAPAIALFYGEPALTKLTIWLSIGFLISGAGTQHNALLRRRMAFGSTALIDVVAMAIGIAAAIVAAWSGMGPYSLVVLHLVIAVVMTLGSWILCSWRPGKPHGVSSVRSMLAFGGDLTAFNVLVYLCQNADSVLIGRFVGTRDLGLYSKAYQMFTLPMQQINAPISSVVVSALSRLSDNPERLREAFKRVLATVCLVSMPLAAYMIGTADWLVLLFLGPQWTEASRIFAWLGLVAFVLPVSHSTGWVFVSEGRTREQLQWGIIASITTVASFVAGLPWGAIGVAAAYAITAITIRTPLLLWWVGRRGAVRTSDFYRTATPAFLASLAAVGAILILRQTLDVHPATGLALAFAVTVGTTIFVMALLPSGRKMLSDARESVSTFLPGKTPPAKAA